MLYRQLNFVFFLFIFGNASILIISLIASDKITSSFVPFLLIVIINIVCFVSVNFNLKLIDTVSEDIKFEESHYTRALTSVPYRSLRFFWGFLCLIMASVQLVQLK